MSSSVESLESRRMFAVYPTGFAQSLVAEGFDSPTSMTAAPDGRIFVAEQAGRLRVIKNGSLLSTPFVTVNTVFQGERGLLGVELDPSFSSNGFVYVYYTLNGTTANRVSRFTASGDVASAGSEKVLFQTDVTGGEASIHQGGALHFGPDGKLYITTGDHGGRSRAQLLTNQFGKVLRINSDGTIPADNPFYDQTTGKNKAIWARGLRNPFTFGFQPGTGLMYINDVGENTWEEIDQGRAGANYGWADTEGATTDPRFDSPIYTYHHTEGRAIVGGTFYNPPAGASAKFPAQYVGDYFFTDFDRRFLRTIDPATKNVTGFATALTGKPVDLDVGADGSLFYLSRAITNVNAAGVYRIRYTGSAAPVIGTQPGSRTVSVGQPATFSVSATGAGTLGYQWQRDGVNIPGATQSTYTLPSATLADSGAKFRVIVTNAAGTATSNAATLTVTTNRAPTATVTAPASGATYQGGSVINFAGTGTDPEDGTLPASAFSWRVDFHHDQHTHPFVGTTTGTRSGSFTVPTDNHGAADVWYRIVLTVTDSRGMTHTTFRDVKPITATITVTANVPGLRLMLDESPVTAPVSVLGVAGMKRSIGAPATQVLNGVTYQFVSWSDGGAATHELSFPSSNRTYTATYRATSGTTKTLSSIADAGVRDDPGGVTINSGTTGELLVRTRPPGQLNRHAYFKFDLTSVSNIASAKLRLFGRLVSTLAGESVTTGVFSAASEAWTEPGLNWNNKPASGSTPLSTVTVSTGAAKWYEFDVTDYLRQQKAAGKTTVTLVIKNITASKTSAAFRTKEASSNRPQLVVSG